MAPDLEKMLAACDAALLIGDPALVMDRSRYMTVLDLAEEWRRFTGKPFVFAFWAVREDAVANLQSGLNLAEIFQLSRDHGLQSENLENIVREWAPKLYQNDRSVMSYLTENIHYSLDEACLDGLRLYYRYATEFGALSKIPELRFL